MRRLSSGSVTSAQSSFLVLDLDECLLSEPECFLVGIFPASSVSVSDAELVACRRFRLMCKSSDEATETVGGTAFGVDSPWGCSAVSNSELS